jgi:hypothetical protein
MSIFGWMPGADVNSIVERELANQDLNSTRDGFADRTGAWNWQDSFGAWMANTNKEEVLRLATARANKNLSTILNPRAKEAGALLGPLTSRYTGVDGKTVEQLEAELTADERRGSAVQTAAANNPNFDISSLSPTATAGEIFQSSSKATKAENERKEREERTRRQKETERQEGRTDDWRRSEIIRDERIRSEGRLDRNLDKQMNAENNKMQLQLEYARLSQADRQRTADRKDKAIMALLSGLGNLGAGFTI